MFKKYVALAALVALSAPISAVEEGAVAAPIEVGISVTSTRFYARNYSEFPQVLLFESGGRLIWRTLASGHDLAWDYPTQMLTGVRFEVASWKDGSWKRSGTIDLAAIAARGTDAIWIQGDVTRTSWSEIGSVLFLEDTGSSLFPATLPSGTSEGTIDESLMVVPTHVPVITPSDSPPGDVPPVIDDKPLPPV